MYEAKQDLRMDFLPAKSILLEYCTRKWCCCTHQNQNEKQKRVAPSSVGTLWVGTCLGSYHLAPLKRNYFATEDYFLIE